MYRYKARRVRAAEGFDSRLEEMHDQLGTLVGDMNSAGVERSIIKKVDEALSLVSSAWADLDVTQ